MDDTLTNYLRDLVELLVENGRKTRMEVERVRSDFEIGRLMAIYEVVSLMQSQADAFGIPRESIWLDGIDPDRELIAKGSVGV